MTPKLKEKCAFYSHRTDIAALQWKQAISQNHNFNQYYTIIINYFDVLAYQNNYVGMLLQEKYFYSFKVFTHSVPIFHVHCHSLEIVISIREL